MKTTMCAFGVLLASVSALAAGSAQAADTLFTAPDNDAGLQVQHWSGQPVWRLQAYCAGVMGASNNWFADHGQTARADEAAGLSRAFMASAVDRLSADRRMGRSEASELAKGVAGAAFDETRFDETNFADSEGNVRRSDCLTLRDIIKG